MAEPGQCGSSELELDEAEVKSGISISGCTAALKYPTLGAGYRGESDEGMYGVSLYRDPELLACHAMRMLCSRSSLLE